MTVKYYAALYVGEIRNGAILHINLFQRQTANNEG